MNIFSLASLATKFTGFTPGGFLLKNWKLVAIVVLVLAVVADHYYLVAEVNAEKVQIVQLKSDKAICEANVAKVSGALADQTSLIKYWASVDKKRAAELEALKATIAARQSQANAALEAIKKDPKLNTCQDALQYLFNAAKEIK